MGAFAVAAFVLCVAVLAPLLLAPSLRRAAAPVADADAGTDVAATIGTGTSPARTVQALALALPALAIAVYLLIGTPAALDPSNVAAPETLDDAIAQLERRLEEEPASVEGWVLLARSRIAQERYADARDAFAKAVALLPDDPDLLVEFADARMRAAGDGRFPPDATADLERIVAANPRHQRALFYLGAQRLQAGQPAEAAALWERLLPLVEAKTAAALRPQVDAARAQAGLPPLAPAGPAIVDGPSIEVTVALAPEMAAQLPEGGTLFVFARPADGAGPPVAAARVAADDFPVTLVLSDADSVMPTAKLSQQAQVQVVARVSAGGDALGAAGDLESAAQVIAVGDDAKIALSLDRIRE